MGCASSSSKVTDVEDLTAAPSAAQAVAGDVVTHVPTAELGSAAAVATSGDNVWQQCGLP